jgi:hypothetical protein
MGDAPADHRYVKVRTFTSRTAAQEVALGWQTTACP